MVRVEHDGVGAEAVQLVEIIKDLLEGAGAREPLGVVYRCGGQPQGDAGREQPAVSGSSRPTASREGCPEADARRRRT